MADAWEYRLLYLVRMATGELTTRDIDDTGMAVGPNKNAGDTLNTLGAEGWETVGIGQPGTVSDPKTETVILLKRRKQ